MKRKMAWLAAAVGALLLVALLTRQGRILMWAAFTRVRGRATVEDRLRRYGPEARRRLAPHFATAGVEYPPGAVTLLALKRERRLEVYVGTDHQSLRFLRAYEIKGASGELGPKLREGDRQVPEGIYEIESLNPNSLFHLALRVGYPNARDREQAARDGRTDLGGDIMIHGGSGSVGCLAMGDAVAEELFVLAADTGLERVRVVSSPLDFRDSEMPRPGAGWIEDLYRDLAREVARLPSP